MFSIHATKKLLDRVDQPAEPAVAEPTTALGNWYATALFWKPQVGLLVNERTLFPVLMPLAPAATLMARFPDSLQQTLEAGGIATDFIEPEIAAMGGALEPKCPVAAAFGIGRRTTSFRRLRLPADVCRAYLYPPSLASPRGKTVTLADKGIGGPSPKGPPTVVQ